MDRISKGIIKEYQSRFQNLTIRLRLPKCIVKHLQWTTFVPSIQSNLLLAPLLGKA